MSPVATECESADSALAELLVPVELVEDEEEPLPEDAVLGVAAEEDRLDELPDDPQPARASAPKTAHETQSFSVLSMSASVTKRSDYLLNGRSPASPRGDLGSVGRDTSPRPCNQA